MNQRERILLAIVGGCCVLFAGWWMVSWYGGRVFARQIELADVQSKLEAQQRIIRQGQQAAQRLARYEQQSLPSNLERAQSLYQDWLLELVQKHKIAGSNVTTVSGRASRGVYHQFTFSIKGRSNLRSITELLHDFYAVDHLHRIRRLRMKPVPDSTDVDLDLLIEALALVSAPDAEKLDDRPSHRLKHGDVADYVKHITERNFFGPPHQPPTVANTARSTYNLGSNVTFTVRGTDPERRPVVYAIDEANFDGAQLDEKLGTFYWKPEEKGNYELTVRVTDTGVPPKSTTQVIKFAVVDPPPPPPERVVTPTPTPPPPPKFDAAKFTYLTAIIDVEGQQEAWLIVRTSGETLKLQPGEEFDVGTLQGKIRTITNFDIEIETADGKRLLVGIGENLRDGYELRGEDL